MGAADIIPGISGGTVAFIMGFYNNLIESIKNVGWQFLIPLALGISISFFLLASPFDYILGHPIYRIYLYSSFLGLILASTIYCANLIDRWKSNYWMALLTGAIAAYLLTGTAIQNREPTLDIELAFPIQTNQRLLNYDPEMWRLLDVPATTAAAMVAKGILQADHYAFDHESRREGELQIFIKPYLGTHLDLKLVFCGAIAISAMLLPGISGSYLLTILGVYAIAIGALADFSDGLKNLEWDNEAFMILASLGVGIILGALSFSHVVSWLMRNFYNGTIAGLTGFMLGALKSVWPFWSYAYALAPLKLQKGPQLQVVSPILPDLHSSLFWIALAFAIGGFGLVFLIEFLAQKRKKTAPHTT